MTPFSFYLQHTKWDRVCMKCKDYFDSYDELADHIRTEHFDLDTSSCHFT